MERIDDLQRGGCRIIQRPELFCFGMDAVLLAAWAEVKPGDRVLDLCSGNGIVPILMDARLPEEIRREGSVHFTGVEINPTCVDLARRSAQMNGQAERIRFFEGDVRGLFRAQTEPKQVLSDGRAQEQSVQSSGSACAGQPGQNTSSASAEQSVQSTGSVCTEQLVPESYDCVTVNPPYMAGSGGLKGPSEDRAIARHEVLCTIDDVAWSARRALKQRGHLYMVHRPHRLGDIFRALTEHGLAVKRMRMVHPFVHKEANLVLIDAVKGGKSYVHAEAPLVIYREKGVYTEELKALYG